MKLSVPFIPDKHYADFLNLQCKNIESVYFPFPMGSVLDARMRFRTQADFNEIIHCLGSLKNIKKYALLNTRFIHPELYSDLLFLKQTQKHLDILMSGMNLTGIVFCDAYLLNALAAFDKKQVSQLEAVPGINCMLDSPQKIFAFLECIEQAGFKSPGKITLDRSLNREMDQLENIVKTVRCAYPDIQFELLANEGCIHLCPYKLTHDAQISFANLDTAKDSCFPNNRTFSINRAIGCHAYFFKYPQRFLKSPFIRPEDMDQYSDLADTLKICGRTLGAKFLTQCIHAYTQKSHAGNLLDLMDATNWLADLYHIENKSLGPDYLNTVTHCTKDCKKCTICDTFFKNAATEKSIELKAYKDYL